MICKSCWLTAELAKAEAKVTALESENARLKAPVSNAEWEQFAYDVRIATPTNFLHAKMMEFHQLDNLIASRVMNATIPAAEPGARQGEAMKPPVIHVVTPESSSGKLWEEIQRLHAVEAESARTIAHLNQTHREVSDMQQARIAKLEEALGKIADHRTQLPWSECRRIARAALGPANLQGSVKPEAL